MSEARTDPDLLYVGTHTESIYLVRRDRAKDLLLFPLFKQRATLVILSAAGAKDLFFE